MRRPQQSAQAIHAGVKTFEVVATMAATLFLFAGLAGAYILTFGG